ncbi:hypothetical protein VTN31DRAFT_6550 [Thermomyces dupontii]|uniref:uncharacterized protein n=1 Tax=Talaromyces thermophilus TaxID=28565 RepID=UPI0037428397
MASRAAMLLDPRSYTRHLQGNAGTRQGAGSPGTSTSQAAGQSQPTVDVVFTNGDASEPGGSSSATPKRSREDDEPPDRAPKNLLEEMYGVQRREDQPQKRVKTSKDKSPALQSQRFQIPGNSGLGDYVKERKDSGPTQVVDLTESTIKSALAKDDDGDLQVTGSNDIRSQRVCYGKVEGAMIQAHTVPTPNMNNPFADFTHAWPSMKLGIRRIRGEGSNKIEVTDAQGKVFGSVDSKTAAGIVPLLDSEPLQVEITARLDYRKRQSGEVPGQSCSALYRASVNLYGPRGQAEIVGKVLSQKSLWLVTPTMVEQGVPVWNPHSQLRRTQQPSGPSSMPRPRPAVSYEVRTAEEVNDAVMKMFDQLRSAENIPEKEPPPSIATPLLRHQKQALWFMLEKEQPRKFGPQERDNNSLWRIQYGPNGRKRYREIISGTVLEEEPPQTYGGLLADVMGLGKTLSVLSLVVTTLPDARRWATQQPHPDLVRAQPGIRNAKTTLLVSPLSAVNNWVTQVKEHLKPHALSWYVFHGPTRTSDADDLSQYDLVITTYSTILSELSGRRSRRDQSPLVKMNLFRIVLDEAHAIREQSAAQSQAIFSLNGERRWSVTGTPVQNRLEDLASVTRFLRLYPYDEKAKFSAHILSRFRLGDPNVLASLRVLVDSFTLRRVKDKIDLPPRHDKIIMLDFSESEAQLHEFFRRESNVMMKVIANESKTTMGGRMYHHVLKAMMILRQISAHGKELLDREDRERIKGMSAQHAIDLDDDCGGNEAASDDAMKKKAYEMFNLMQESSADNCSKCGKSLAARAADAGSPEDDPKAVMAVMLSCFDAVCADCFQPWQQAFDAAGGRPMSGTALKCPVCDGWISAAYTVITAGDFQAYVTSQAEEKHNRKKAKQLGEYGGPHTKTRALISHLQRTAEESAQLKGERPIKSVVFSAWTSHLDLIEIALRDHQLTGYTRLDGSMPLSARNRALEQFHSDNNITILLATIGAGGVGLNLTPASRVYIMEPQYNPAAVTQAVDRVHRLGQTREVTTVQFIMRNSIEERIFELAKKKQQLADMSMNRGKLDKREIQEARMREYRSLFR